MTERSQKDVFLSGEGDAWYGRNLQHLRAPGPDIVLTTLETMGVAPKSVLEIGCATGELLDVDLLDITVTGPSQVTIKGERKPAEPKDGTAHRRERIFGSFVRTVTLPSVLDADKVEAKLENGVLKLTLPKHEAAKPRKITVKA